MYVCLNFYNFGGVELFNFMIVIQRVVCSKRYKDSSYALQTFNKTLTSLMYLLLEYRIEIIKRKITENKSNFNQSIPDILNSIFKSGSILSVLKCDDFLCHILNRHTSLFSLMKPAILFYPQNVSVLILNGKYM